MGMPTCTWCRAPQYHEYVTECLANKDLVKAGRLNYDITAKQKRYGDNVHELDASYCFIEKHCTNEVVTEHTTLGEP